MAGQPAEYVYLIGNAESPLVKIGRSVDVEERLATIQRMSPAKLAVLWQIKGGAGLETALHRWFRPQRSHGEWFEFPDHDAPERVSRAIPEIAREAQEALRVRAERKARKREAGKMRKVRAVWTAPAGPTTGSIQQQQTVGGHRAGDVVRIVREGWRYTQTGVIRFVLADDDHPIMVTENDGRRHRYLAQLAASEVAPQTGVPRRPVGAPCRGIGCMCANVV